jgi:hypothetical protein
MHRVCDHDINQEGVNANKLEQEADKYYPGNLVILARKSTGGGTGVRNAVIMPEYHCSPPTCHGAPHCSHDRYNNMLAHEIGHYFLLAHPFHDCPHFPGFVAHNKAEAQGMLAQYNYDPVAAFDRDLEENGIADTPPDPFWEAIDIKCPADPKEAVEFDNGSGGEITLYFDRTNVMSYYEISNTIINKLTPGQIRAIYKSLIERGFQ